MVNIEYFVLINDYVWKLLLNTSGKKSDSSYVLEYSKSGQTYAEEKLGTQRENNIVEQDKKLEKFCSKGSCD